jgi:phosphocarrier protein HPr
MIKQPVTIQNQLGLHTRAAAKLVDIAKKYESKIEMRLDDRTVDCKSIMGLITLGAHKNNIVDLMIDGADEREAFNAIKELIDAKFGED